MEQQQLTQQERPPLQSNYQERERFNTNQNNRNKSEDITRRVVVQGQFTYKSKFLCLFCGGKSCKKENYLKNPHQNAIDGLLSDWITNRILAMQRPSSRIIKKFKIIEQFKEHNIKAVFNLQLPGEHPYCGDGLELQSGFTYHPEDFINAGIYFFNIAWVDMTVCDIKTIMKIMNMMEFIFKQGGKISVHCHAGTGRTGLAIGSWLIYGEDFTAEQAIKQFQQRRHSGLSKGSQKTFLKNFEQVIRSNRKSFFLKKPLDIQEIIDKQQSVSQGELKSKTKNLPIVQYIALNILQSKIEQGDDPISIIKCFIEPGNRQYFKTPWDFYCEKEIIRYKVEVNKANWKYLDTFDHRVSVQAMLEFYESLKIPSLRKAYIIKLVQISKNYEESNFQNLFTSKDFLECLNTTEFGILNNLIKFCVDNFLQNMIDMELIVQFYQRILISLLQEKTIQQQYIDRNNRSLINSININNQSFNEIVEFIIRWSQTMNKGNKIYNSKIVERVNMKYSYLKNLGSQLNSKKNNSSNKKKNKEVSSQIDVLLGQNTNMENIIVGSYIKKDSNILEEEKKLDGKQQGNHQNSIQIQQNEEITFRKKKSNSIDQINYENYKKNKQQEEKIQQKEINL